MLNMPEIIDGLPNICGSEEEIAEVTRHREPVFIENSNLHPDRLEAVYAVALHMHQPLVPAGSTEIASADLVSNLDVMMRSPNSGDSYNAGVFADCYGRMGDIIPELAREGHNPRIMLDYSGELLYGLRKMGRGDVLERLRSITCDRGLQRYAEWMGTMWGHSVAPSTPIPDMKLHMRAWQHQFASVFGLDALARVRGFSPPEMHLPNHPDTAFEFISALKECGYQWLLVQEHTVETTGGEGLREKHAPCRLVAKNSCGEEVSLTALIKTQGSDTKLVAQMQPYYEALTLKRLSLGGRQVPPIVTQIGDGENGGVMMNEFPPCYRQTVARYGTGIVAGATGTEYLEMLAREGVTEDVLTPIQPVHQGRVFQRIDRWEPGAADRAIEEIRKEDPGFAMEGGSWTGNISWVRGYENVLTPMNRLSAEFHALLDGKSIDTGSTAYRNALFHLLVSQTSCFRYWGQGLWTDYAREICRRGHEALKRASPG